MSEQQTTEHAELVRRPGYKLVPFPEAFAALEARVADLEAKEEERQEQHSPATLAAFRKVHLDAAHAIVSLEQRARS